MQLNIAYINHTSIIGGAETNLINILSNIDHNHFIPKLVFLPENGKLVEQVEKIGIKTRIISYYSLILKNPFLYLSTFVNLIISLIKEKIDIIHLNHHFLINYISTVSNLINKPLICHCRGSNLAPFFSKHAKSIMKVQCFIAVSESIAQELYDLGIDKSKVEIIYDGIDIHKFYREKKTNILRKEFNLNENDLIVGVISRIEPKKGSSDIIYAAQKVKKYVKDVKFIFIGESGITGKDYIAELKLLAKNLEVEEMFRFAGFRNNITEILHGLDLLVLPSWDEALPNILLESMASGVLTISTNVGGVSEIINDAETGFLVEARNSVQLADVIIKAVTIDPDEGDRIISAAERMIKEKFSLRSQIEKIEYLYRKIKKDN